MTLVEGIGDEVIYFFILLGIALIGLFAWWSTNISERPLVRTVVILERRTTRPSTSESQASSTVQEDSNETVTETVQPETEQKSMNSDNTASNETEINVVDNMDNIIINDEELPMVDVEDIVSELAMEDCPQDEMEYADATNETDEPTVVRNRRLTFFQYKDDNSKIQNENSCPKKVQDEGSTSTKTDEGNIRIRIKYLNEDQKLVEGKLQEQLGDFKKRHFSLELSGRNLVRLIFNGKVLHQDTKTLQNYGFFDNCVVHCLVQQPRTPPPSPNLNRPRTEATQNETANNQWDLGNIFFASLSFLLGLAWYGRYQYSQLYTATTTVALIGLTGMFTVSVIGLYMPDFENVRTI